MSYTPKQGDIIWVDFNPQSGREQKGRRPALVVWNNEMIKRIPGLCQVCAISHTDNGFPLHVKLDSVSKNTDGFVFCEQHKVLDLNARNAEFKDKVSNEVLDKVINILIASIEKIP